MLLKMALLTRKMLWMNRRISALSHRRGSLQALLIIEKYSAGTTQFLSNNDNKTIKYSLQQKHEIFIISCTSSIINKDFCWEHAASHLNSWDCSQILVTNSHGYHNPDLTILLQERKQLYFASQMDVDSKVVQVPGASRWASPQYIASGEGE